MKIVGIVSEYNPFHNGHKYQINWVKQNIKDSLIVALTTNYFAMNGSVSVLNKYDKTKIEIEAGIDLVLEYPYLLSCHSADKFCFNAVKLLNDFGVNCLVSGSESNDLNLIKKVYEIESSDDFQNEIKEYINKGFSYRESFSKTLESYDLTDLKSNDLLNLKYYSAIQQINPNIELVLIERKNNDYLDKTLNESNIQSATTLRELIKNKEDITPYIPYGLRYINFLDYNEFTKYLNYSITTNDLSILYEAKEGIENSFKNKRFDSLDEALEQMISKRYTKNRIRRFISYILTNRVKDLPLDYTQRVLGMSFKGSEYLKQNKDNLNYTTKIKDGFNNVSDFEMRLAKLFSSVYGEDFVFMEQFYLPFVRKDM